MGHDISVSTAVCYRMDGPCIESRFERRFPRPSRPVLGLVQTPAQWGYLVSLPGVKLPGCGLNHPPVSNAEVKERVELYLYTPSRPSWPVLGQITVRIIYLYKVRRIVSNMVKEKWPAPAWLLGSQVRIRWGHGRSSLVFFVSCAGAGTATSWSLV